VRRGNLRRETTRAAGSTLSECLEQQSQGEGERRQEGPRDGPGLKGKLERCQCRSLPCARLQRIECTANEWHLRARVRLRQA